jgi:hypothetical protein
MVVETPGVENRSLGELKDAVETLACSLCSHNIVVIVLTVGPLK